MFYVAELTSPGTFLDDPRIDPKRRWELESTVRSLGTALDDVATLLHLFDTEVRRARGRRPDNSLQAREQWEAEAEERHQQEKRLRRERGVGEYDFLTRDSIREEAEIAIKRRRWHEGHLSRQYQENVVFIYARSFIYALDRLEGLSTLFAKDSDAPEAVREAKRDFDAAFPSLVPTRDSLAYYEERVRGLEYGRPIQLKPINNAMISAPGGGVLVSEALNGNRFGTTVRTGDYVEVEISITSVKAAQACVQKCINAFQWKGSRQHMPR